MSVTIESAALKSALARVKWACDLKSRIPILACARIEARGGEVVMTTTDMDALATIVVPADSSEAWTVAVPFKALEAAAKTTKGSIELSTAAGGLLIRAGAGQSTIKALDHSDFPSCVNLGDLGGSIVIPASTLRDISRKVGFAMSTDDRRYYLRGIHIHRDETGFHAVATDGHRMAVMDVAARSSAGTWDPVIVAHGSINGLGRALPGRYAGDVEIERFERGVIIRLPDMTIVSKAIDGTFPDYKRVVPSFHLRPPASATVDRAALLSALSSVGSAEQAGFYSDGRELVIQTDDADGGEAESALPADFSGDFRRFGANRKYMLDAATAFDGDNVTIAHDGPDSPMVIRDGDAGYYQVLMPCGLFEKMRPRSSLADPVVADAPTPAEVFEVAEEAPSDPSTVEIIEAESDARDTPPAEVFGEPRPAEAAGDAPASETIECAVPDTDDSPRDTTGARDEIAARYAAELGANEVSDFHRAFADGILQRDAESLMWIVNGVNKVAPRLFQAVTGYRLPRGIAAGRAALEAWGGRAGVLVDMAWKEDSAALWRRVKSRRVAAERIIMGERTAAEVVDDFIADGFRELVSATTDGGRRVFHLVRPTDGFRVNLSVHRGAAVSAYARAVIAAMDHDAANSAPPAEFLEDPAPIDDASSASAFATLERAVVAESDEPLGPLVVAYEQAVARERGEEWKAPKPRAERSAGRGKPPARELPADKKAEMVEIVGVDWRGIPAAMIAVAEYLVARDALEDFPWAISHHLFRLPNGQVRNASSDDTAEYRAALGRVRDALAAFEAAVGSPHARLALGLEVDARDAAPAEVFGDAAGTPEAPSPVEIAEVKERARDVPPAGEGEKLAPAPRWRGGKFRLHETPAVRIGKHEWRVAVVIDPYLGRTRFSEWRHLESVGEWNHYRDWPSYDFNGHRSGLPASIGKKVYDKFEAEIDAAMNRKFDEATARTILDDARAYFEKRTDLATVAAELGVSLEGAAAAVAGAPPEVFEARHLSTAPFFACPIHTMYVSFSL